MKTLKIFILFLAVSIPLSCQTNQQGFIKVDEIHSRARHVALLYFANHTNNPQAGKIVTDLMSSELYTVPDFQMMEQSAIHEKLKKSKHYDDDYLESVLDNISAREIGKLLGVDTVIFGSVSEYRYKMDLSEVPAVGINIRLLDVESGEILWTASKSQTGNNSWFLKDSLNSLAQKTCRKLVKSISKPR